jgi:hypothetical protein
VANSNARQAQTLLVGKMPFSKTPLTLLTAGKKVVGASAGRR